MIGSILAGGDNIDGVAVLRAGATGSLFDVQEHLRADEERTEALLVDVLAEL